MKKEKAKSKFKDMVLEEAKKGNVVFMGLEGPMAANLKKFVEQPTAGLLYDLNRLPEVVLTFIDDPKWVNDYAVSLTITELKEQLDVAQYLLRQAFLVNQKRNKSPCGRN